MQKNYDFYLLSTKFVLAFTVTLCSVTCVNAGQVVQASTQIFTEQKKLSDHVYYVILAGGSGERLWPLSKQDRPKQLIPFLNNRSLLEQTIDRIAPMAKSKEHILVVTNTQHESVVDQMVGESIGGIICESVGRNTGPAVLRACLTLQKKDPEALVVMLPADHFIPEKQKFYQVLAPAIDYAAKQEQMVIFGLKPTFAATGYGYIQAGTERKSEQHESFNVARFHEKPERALAESYLKRQDMFWNIGIFVGKTSVFIQEFTKHAPELVSRVNLFMNGARLYHDVPNISIDYAVMEKSKNITVFVADFEWHDVGNLNTFLSIKSRYESPKEQNIVSVEAYNNLVSSDKKIVALIGVHDLCVVQTDHEIVIAAKDQVELVKQVLAELKKRGELGT
jgi:mannose-1-phosphate guanylyltransferase